MYEPDNLGPAVAAMRVLKATEALLKRREALGGKSAAPLPPEERKRLEGQIDRQIADLSLAGVALALI